MLLTNYTKFLLLSINDPEPYLIRSEETLLLENKYYIFVSKLQIIK